MVVVAARLSARRGLDGEWFRPQLVSTIEQRHRDAMTSALRLPHDVKRAEIDHAIDFACEMYVRGGGLSYYPTRYDFYEFGRPEDIAAELDVEWRVKRAERRRRKRREAACKARKPAREARASESGSDDDRSAPTCTNAAQNADRDGAESGPRFAKYSPEKATFPLEPFNESETSQLVGSGPSLCGYGSGQCVPMPSYTDITTIAPKPAQISAAASDCVVPSFSNALPRDFNSAFMPPNAGIGRGRRRGRGQAMPAPPQRRRH